MKILDVAVFTTGQWWLGKPKVYMLGGSPADLSMTGALAGGLRTLTNHVLTSSFRGLPIFQTISPSHFFGGAWNTAGKCPMKVLSDEEIAGNAREYGGEHTLKVWRTQTEMIRDGSVFELMDVFTVSEARSDGHPGNFTPGGHWDCVHWCEPGVVDTWVQLFYAMVEVSKLSLGSTRG